QNASVAVEVGGRAGGRAIDERRGAAAAAREVEVGDRSEVCGDRRGPRSLVRLAKGVPIDVQRLVRGRRYVGQPQRHRVEADLEDADRPLDGVQGSGRVPDGDGTRSTGGDGQIAGGPRHADRVVAAAGVQVSEEVRHRVEDDKLVRPVDRVRPGPSDDREAGEVLVEDGGLVGALDEGAIGDEDVPDGRRGVGPAQVLVPTGTGNGQGGIDACQPARSPAHANLVEAVLDIESQRSERADDVDHVIAGAGVDGGQCAGECRLGRREDVERVVPPARLDVEQGQFPTPQDNHACWAQALDPGVGAEELKAHAIGGRVGAVVKVDVRPPPGVGNGERGRDAAHVALTADVDRVPAALAVDVHVRTHLFDAYRVSAAAGVQCDGAVAQDPGVLDHEGVADRASVDR